MFVVLKDFNSRQTLRQQFSTHNKSRRAPGGLGWRVLEGVTWGRERAQERAPLGSRCGSRCRVWGRGQPGPRAQPPHLSGHGRAWPAFQRPPAERRLGLPTAATGFPRPGLPAGGGRHRAGPAVGTPRRPEQPGRERGARTVRISAGGRAGAGYLTLPATFGGGFSAPGC